MENTKTVKALKKQLVAAIAMVLVAAVALGSSTYAWFVSNNKVEGTVSTISAQSNAPFLKITAGNGTIDETTKTTYSYVQDVTTENKALFPVQMTAYGEGAFTWETAYAIEESKSDENKDTRFTVASKDEENYYLKESFKIGTDGTTEGTFKNLRVDSVKLNNTANSSLDTALRLMVVCGENVVILDGTGTVVTTYKKASATPDVTITGVADEANAALAETIGKGQSVVVDVYVYYDGADEKVTTKDIDKLTAIGAIITFTANDAATNATY